MSPSLTSDSGQVLSASCTFSVDALAGQPGVCT